MNNDTIIALREVHDFLAQVKSALKCKKIRDVDTGWRMANQILPSAKSFERFGDMEETECSYRKIHLSDVLDVALSLPWDTIITQLEQGVDLEKGAGVCAYCRGDGHEGQEICNRCGGIGSVNHYAMAIAIDFPDGTSLYVKPNEAGGHTYYTDEIGCGVIVWDTCLVSSRTVKAALDHHEANNVKVKE